MGAPIDNVQGPLSDLVICSLLVARITHLDFLGDGPNASDAFDSTLGGNLFRIAFNVACEGHDACFDRNADMGGINAWFEIKLVNNILTKNFVIHCRFHSCTSPWAFHRH